MELVRKSRPGKIGRNNVGTKRKKRIYFRKKKPSGQEPVEPGRTRKFSLQKVPDQVRRSRGTPGVGGVV